MIVLRVNDSNANVLAGVTRSVSVWVLWPHTFPTGRIYSLFNVRPLTFPVWCWALISRGAQLPALVTHRSGGGGISSSPRRPGLLSAAEGEILAEDLTKCDFCRNLKSHKAEDGSWVLFPVRHKWKLNTEERWQTLLWAKGRQITWFKAVHVPVLAAKFRMCGQRLAIWIIPVDHHFDYDLCFDYVLFTHTQV